MMYCQAAKPSWKTFSYDTITKMTSGDVIVTQTWNGAAYRTRQKMPGVKYAYPKEGIEGWMDNVSVLKDAKNVENAKLFQNFMMAPENAGTDFGISRAMIMASGQLGLVALPKELKSAPEVNRPAEAPVAGIRSAMPAGSGRNLQQDLDGFAKVNMIRCPGGKLPGLFCCSGTLCPHIKNSDMPLPIMAGDTTKPGSAKNGVGQAAVEPLVVSACARDFADGGGLAGQRDRARVCGA